MTAPATSEEATRAFSELTRRIRGEVDRELGVWLTGYCDRARPLGADVLAVAEAVSSLTLRGGKRLRPALIAAAYEACASSPSTAAVVLCGVAMELLQSYLLIHDDWMDEGDVRRGGPAVHVALRGTFGSIKGGDCAAILAGDQACAVAQRALCAIATTPARLGRVMREFACIQEDVIFGQLLDARASAHLQREGTVTVDSVLRTHDFKTGSYTVRGPLMLGAALAGASEEVTSALLAFAYPLGLAFQLRDDCMGTFGDARLTGKPVLSDLREGKVTALIAEAMRDPGARGSILESLGKPGVTDDDLLALAKQIEASGALARVEARISDLLEEAEEKLAQVPVPPRARAVLRGAAGALAFRQT